MLTRVDQGTDTALQKFRLGLGGKDAKDRWPFEEEFLVKEQERHHAMQSQADAVEYHNGHCLEGQETWALAHHDATQIRAAHRNKPSPIGDLEDLKNVASAWKASEMLLRDEEQASEASVSTDKAYAFNATPALPQKPASQPKAAATTTESRASRMRKASSSSLRASGSSLKSSAQSLKHKLSRDQGVIEMIPTPGPELPRRFVREFAVEQLASARSARVGRVCRAGAGLLQRATLTLASRPVRQTMF